MVDENPSSSSAAPQSGPKRKREFRRYVPRRKICTFCADKIAVIDYKDLGRLRRYLSDRARIEPRRKTGTCAKHQRLLSVALKRARHLALLPYTAEQLRGFTSGMGMGRHSAPPPYAQAGQQAPPPPAAPPPAEAPAATPTEVSAEAPVETAAEGQPATE